MTTDTPEPHRFEHPIRKVAVVGSGASGAPAARHLRDSGLEVTVFERQPSAGGIWNWSPEITTPLSVPTPPPSRGAFFPSLPSGDLGAERAETLLEDESKQEHMRFSPPNPVYWSLSNNVPTSTMAFKDFPYPPGTAENIPHHEIAGYVKAYARHFELDKITSFSTRVEKAVKVPASPSSPPKWRLTLRKVEAGEGTTLREVFWHDEFDALVVATGHYNAPFIPDLEGSSSWAAQWPRQVLHSNGYRIPQPYKGKNVLIVGIGTSGIDIARDLSLCASKVYMSGKDRIRGPDGYQTMRRFQRFMIPDNAAAVSEILRFIPPPVGSTIEEGRIELKDRTVLTGISLVIFATGYQYSYPFLPHLHLDPIDGSPSEEDNERLLITDGSGVRNLYRDVFYNPDPTLTFLGLSVNTSAFSFFEYQSISVARVFTGKAVLPTLSDRRAAYQQLLREKGDGKFIHFMGKEGERKYVRETVEWLNRDAEWSGAAPLAGHSKEWLAASDKIQPLILAKYGLDAQVVLAQIAKDKAKDAEEVGNSTSQLSPEQVEAPPPQHPTATSILVS